MCCTSHPTTTSCGLICACFSNVTTASFGCCAHRAIEEREAARIAALAKAEMAKTAFEEVRQVSSELERKRLKKLEQDRIAVRGISYAYVLLLNFCLDKNLLCDGGLRLVKSIDGSLRILTSKWSSVRGREKN